MNHRHALITEKILKLLRTSSDFYDNDFNELDVKYCLQLQITELNRLLDGIKEGE